MAWVQKLGAHCNSFLAITGANAQTTQLKSLEQMLLSLDTIPNVSVSMLVAILCGCIAKLVGDLRKKKQKLFVSLATLCVFMCSAHVLQGVSESACVYVRFLI